MAAKQIKRKCLYKDTILWFKGISLFVGKFILFSFFKKSKIQKKKFIGRFFFFTTESQYLEHTFAPENFTIFIMVIAPACTNTTHSQNGAGKHLAAKQVGAGF